MIKIDDIIIVEGKHDKIKLSSFIDATIITTNGFRIFKDKKKLDMIRELTKSRNCIIITDSDSAGFVIRGYLKGAIDNKKIINVYIPDVLGKEKRKKHPSKEGKLGVEGLTEDVILEAMRKAHVPLEKSEVKLNNDENKITMLDFYDDGLTGAKNSKLLRGKLIKKLKLPEYISTKALLEVINIRMNREEYKKLVEVINSL